MEERLDRICRMEQRLTRLNVWLDALSAVEDARTQAEEDAAALADYLAGADWRADFEADEAGTLPADLPRGVLSEDGIYNALERRRELLDAPRKGKG